MIARQTVAVTLAIAQQTLLEASRRRLLISLLLLTGTLVGLCGLGFSYLPHLHAGHGQITHDEVIQVSSVLEILLVFMFSFLMSFAAVFVAAPMLAGDIESGVMLAVATRPIGRAEIVLGRWLGLFVLVAGYSFSAVIVQLEVVNLVVGFLPPHPLSAVLYVAAEGTVAMTLGLALSTRFSAITGGIIAIILLLADWFAGIIGNIGVAFANSIVEAVGIVARTILPTDGLWRGAVYYLQTEELVNGQRLLGRRGAGNPFYAPNPPDALYIAWVGAWIVLMLALTIWSFRRREL